MHRGVAKTLIILAGAFAVSALPAQDLSNYTSFTVDGKTVQFHGFVSEGFAYSNDNNYLTMDTSQGSFFTDGGVNVSSQLTDRFRVGAQIYDRDIGHLTEWHPTLDWAVADYRFKEWFGIRAGKVKTALGLFNETQDMESVHTWALLPQSVYPLDLRSRNLSHTGADIYGQIGLRCAGSLDYTFYGGKRPNDTRDGIYYGWASLGYPNTAFTGKMAGTDLRWNTPVTGLMLGGSYAAIEDKYNFIDIANGPVPVAGTLTSTTKWIASAYGDYSTGRWRFNGEYRRNFDKDWQVDPDPGQTDAWWYSDKGWFVSAVYQISKRLEVGTYHSRYYFDVHSSPIPTTHYIRDQVVTLHYMPTRYLSVKLEAHIMDGTGDIWASHGFYEVDNPNGLKPTTNMLVLRAGWNF
jgi:hypothetical protein